MRIKQDKRAVSNVIVFVLGLVIIVVIVSNVFLWNYEMNQLDWEKMQEDINIVDVTRITEVSSYNPSGYTLGGSTSLVSGSVSNLTSDDGVYMTFRSYYSGTDTSDYVDNNTSNIDSSDPEDKGTHSNFTTQKYYDSIYDTLTEENTAGGTSDVFTDGFEDQTFNKWDQQGATNWYISSYYAHGGTYSACSDSNCMGDLISDDIDLSGATSAGFEFWTYATAVDANEFLLYFYNGTAYNLIKDLDVGDDVWNYHSESISSQYFVSNFRIRVYTTGLGVPQDVFVDDVKVNKTLPDNYELDLEIQWTNANYTRTNEELCIKTGTTDDEDIKVYTWNVTGESWHLLDNDLDASSWNNYTVTSYLTSSTFTVRFLGGTETGDITPDSWNIDVTLLHVWDDQYTTEVEFTGSSNTEDWTQLNWTIDNAWTISSVDVTLQLYNYTLDGYIISGNGYMAYTSDSTPNTDEAKNQTITTNPTHFRNATGHWKMKVKGVKVTDTQFNFKADWIELRARGEGGTRFTFENGGSLTSHLVSLWVINSTDHQRYDVDLIINSGQTLTYTRFDVSLPSGECIIKVVTERGNIATYIES